MANHKSSEKRARQSDKRRQRNRQNMSKVKSAIRSLTEAIAKGDAQVPTLLRSAQSLIDKAATKGLLHANNSARRVSRLVKKAAKAS